VGKLGVGSTSSLCLAKEACTAEAEAQPRRAESLLDFTSQMSCPPLVTQKQEQAIRWDDSKIAEALFDRWDDSKTAEALALIGCYFLPNQNYGIPKFLIINWFITK
jgi:hypothetical protein